MAFRSSETNTSPARSATGSARRPMAVLVDAAERLLAVHAEQAARQVVAPRVVRAGEPVRLAGALGDELGAAVPADVDHRVHLTRPSRG